MKILIPIDGSDSSIRAVAHVIELVKQLKERPEILLLNVQWNIATGNVKLFINQQTINDYYREQGEAALAGARAKLEASGLAYTYHLSIGTPAEAIAQYANEQGIDQIVLGAGEQRTLASLLLGSVVSKVLHLASMPVMVIK